MKQLQILDDNFFEKGITKTLLQNELKKVKENFWTFPLIFSLIWGIIYWFVYELQPIDFLLNKIESIIRI